MTLKDKIIHVSYELFSTKGYEKTTIADIVKASDSSKGGFYHHFKCKEDILETLLENYRQDLKAYYNNLFDHYNNDTITVFNGVFKAITVYQSEQMMRWLEFMKMLSFVGNSLVIMRLAQSFEKMTENFYFELIVKGNHEALWSIDTPSNIAGLWTREILRIYTAISKLLYDYTQNDFNTFVSLLEFDEELINYLLSTDQITIKQETLNYFETAKLQVAINRYKTSKLVV